MDIWPDDGLNPDRNPLEKFFSGDSCFNLVAVFLPADGGHMTDGHVLGALFAKFAQGVE